jgi:uncharacterized protein YdiU (UPF0061 family)
MAVSGETIDYGPCAFMDRYHPQTVFSSIDRHGRYAYGQQPLIARWNLARLAETLLPLLDNDEKAAIAGATEAVNAFTDRYDGYWLDGMRTKLGLSRGSEDQPGDLTLANAFLSLLEDQQVDFTLAFRHLAPAALGDDTILQALFADPVPYRDWVARWRSLLGADREALAEAMNRANPLYIPRNHLVEAALDAAVNHQDLAPFETLLDVLAQPFTERAGLESHAQSPVDGNPHYRTFCGT